MGVHASFASVCPSISTLRLSVTIDRPKNVPKKSTIVDSYSEGPRGWISGGKSPGFNTKVCPL